jgi:hypothetical protein
MRLGLKKNAGTTNPWINAWDKKAHGAVEVDENKKSEINVFDNSTKCICHARYFRSEFP